MPDDVKTLLQKFPSILRTGDVKLAPNHGVEHHIHTGSHPPFFAKSRRLDPEKLQIAKAEFKRLESASIVRRSKSPRAFHLQMVPKKDGLWWPCGDYCRLNLVTTPDKYILLNMQDLSNGLHGCTIFSKNDLVKGYHQIPVQPRTSQKLQSWCHFACLNICSHLLGCPMLHKHFREWRTVPQMVWKVFLHIWTTHVSALRTGKHTSTIWRIFSKLWPPMTSPSIRKNVCLQHLLLRFLATQFRRQERPPWPITLPKSKITHPLRISSSCNIFPAW